MKFWFRKRKATRKGPEPQIASAPTLTPRVVDGPVPVPNADPSPAPAASCDDETSLGEARHLAQTGKLDAALAILDSIAPSATAWPNAQHLRAGILSRLSRRDEALAVISEAIEKGGERTASLELQANLLLQEGQRGRAEAVLRRAAALRSEDRWTYLNLAYLMNEQGRADEAVSAIRTGLSICPDDALLVAHLGRFLLAAGQVDEADAVLKDAAQNHSTTPLVHVFRSWVLRARGDSDGTEAALRRAIEMDGSKADWHAQLARVLAEKGRYRDAEPVAATALRLQPNSSATRELSDRIAQAAQRDGGAGARPHSPFARPGSFTFVQDDGSDVRLDLLAASPIIHGRAAHLRRTLPPASAVGLMFPSGPDLVTNWLATLAAGLKPLIMQYPTAKQARTYWTSSVTNTLAVAGLHAVLCDAYCRDQGLAELCRVIPADELESAPPGTAGPLAIDAFEILQLSSGTTGHRKGVVFGSDALRRHVDDYNRAIGLTPADRIISWLPLYHDMGYVACFVMPMMLGVDVVMMDPMIWVRRPELLFDAIERHGATVCYMPNFGFELMARCAPRPLPAMRRWISCSEPVSANTSRKFLAAIGASPESFSPCYAMAENIFAVSIRDGLEVRQVDGTDVVSCGRPIAGVEVKVVDGQIWVRSPTSLAAYLGGGDIRDAEGFYPTGDTGAIFDGEVYVAGRKQDILIQAGRKYLLSDVDLRLNELLPDVRGRAAAVAVPDERLGTETLTVLVEAQDFYARDDTSRIEAALSAACGVEPLRVAFVPPRFLTKTSSGKFNRRISRDHWTAVRDRRDGADSGAADLLPQLAGFRDLPQDEPIGDVLDSLSLTVVRGLLRDASLPFSRDLNLRQVEERIRAVRGRTSGDAGPDTIRIVSIAEGRLFDRLRTEHLQELSRRVGRPVQFEHVCVPPSAVLLSDLVFQEYFGSRIPAQDFASVDRVLSKIRNATVLLADDAYDLFWPKEQVYGVLSHNLERDPRADRVSFRFQAYTRQHDRLPLTVVDGSEIPLDQSSPTLRRIEQYLGVPIYRIANVPEFGPYTAEWDYRPLSGQTYAGLDPDAFVAALGGWLAERSGSLKLRRAQPHLGLEMSDAPHFCSALVRQAPVDALIERFRRFCIVGVPASVPYVRKQIELRGRSWVQLPSFAPQALASSPDDYECMLICGAIGPDWPTGKPVIALQHIGHPTRTQNLDNAEELGPFNERSTSGRDWFCPFELDGRRDLAVWASARQAQSVRQGIAGPAAL